MEQWKQILENISKNLAKLKKLLLKEGLVL